MSQRVHDVTALVKSLTHTSCNSIHDKSDYITYLYTSVNCRVRVHGIIACSSYCISSRKNPQLLTRIHIYNTTIHGFALPYKALSVVPFLNCLSHQFTIYVRTYILCTITPLPALCAFIIFWVRNTCVAWRIDKVKHPLNIIMATTINWNEGKNGYFLC